MEGYEFFTNPLYELESGSLAYDDELFEEVETEFCSRTFVPLVKMDLVGVFCSQMWKTLRMCTEGVRFSPKAALPADFKEFIAFKEALRHVQQITSSAPVASVEPEANPVVFPEPEAFPFTSLKPEDMPAVSLEAEAIPFTFLQPETIPFAFPEAEAVPFAALEPEATPVIFPEPKATSTVFLEPEITPVISPVEPKASIAAHGSIFALAQPLQSVPQSPAGLWCGTGAAASIAAYGSIFPLAQPLQSVPTSHAGLWCGTGAAASIAYGFIFPLAQPLQSVPQSPAGLWCGNTVAVVVTLATQIAFCTMWRHRCSCITAWYCQRRRRRARHLWDPHVFFNTGACL